MFNELMWMGSTASTADEWIELRNMDEGATELGTPGILEAVATAVEEVRWGQIKSRCMPYNF